LDSAGQRQSFGYSRSQVTEGDPAPQLFAELGFGTRMAKRGAGVVTRKVKNFAQEVMPLNARDNHN